MTKTETETESPPKSAIVVLTRGYATITNYHILIKRNLAIAKCIGSMKEMDILIFHEGNITPSHQKHISSFTPQLQLFFICIKEHAFKDEKKNIPIYQPTNTFGLNYRHMCSFWFVDFWNYVKEYDMILRIDEDCLIDFSIPDVFDILKNKAVVYGAWSRDQVFVTHGLNQFTHSFLQDYVPESEDIPQHNPSGPYTNVIGLHLSHLRKNELLQQYIKEIDASNHIYTFRWGDLPLWGEVLYYMCDPKSYCKTDKIKYFHGSHNIIVENNTIKANKNNIFSKMNFL
uniref:Uncharacterized protein n=1 Tax=viral metagenome TaxID=1070528 RepID=A0A6C0B097_9ZZZZ